MANPSDIKSFETMYAALTELGLTENEQRLYVTSLNQGPISISKLAELLALPRPNLYKIIDGLIKKGLVDKRSRLRYAKNFSVEPPQTISELLKLKRKEQSSIDHSFIEKLPSYMSEFRQGEGPMKIKVLVGQKDFESVYVQMYEEAQGEIRFCGSVKEFGAAFGLSMIKKNVQKRLEKHVRGKALFLPTERGYFSDEQNRVDQRDVRYLDGFSGFDTSFHVFSNKIVFWQPKVPMAVLVEDEYIVAMMKSVYEGLWERASKA